MIQLYFPIFALFLGNEITKEHHFEALFLFQIKCKPKWKTL